MSLSDTIDKVHLASHALELLDDPVLVAAFARIERDAIEGMLVAGDDSERRRLADQANAIRAVRSMLHMMVQEAAEKPKGLNLP